MRTVLGLGGNLGETEKNLSLALDAINSLCGTRLLRVSNFYRTEAVEVEGPQPPYINCAAEAETRLSPNALLGACLGIESALGRVRTGFKSPRTVDIDLLLYEDVSMVSEELTLPHPRILYRAFVLVPLRDLYPDCRALGLDFSDGFKNIAGQQIELITREKYYGGE